MDDHASRPFKRIVPICTTIAIDIRISEVHVTNYHDFRKN